MNGLEVLLKVVRPDWLEKLAAANVPLVVVL
jgi:hypothetical protein